tara:strand:- start:815 stop:1159 length:345 start_codon:yes stop_codon:yes gene_type:complete
MNMEFDNLFNEYFNTAKQVHGIPTTRQQRGYTGSQRVHQNLIPDRDRVDPTLNSKIEILRGKSSGKEIVSDSDLEYMIPKYNLRNLTKTSPKFLGKTGIKLYWDEGINNFVIEK